MSLRHGILALLSQGSMHGYQLKAAFEQQTGGVWSINVGQVYTTLDRLARDGLVREVPSGDDDGRRPFSLTEEGRAELDQWFGQPTGSPDAPSRDELITKVLVAIEADGVEPTDVIARQRTALIGALQAHRRKGDRAVDGDLAARLASDALVVKIEAELRWLDLCDERLAARQKTSKGRLG